MLWNPASWQQKNYFYYPDYPCANTVAQVVQALNVLPPLVTVSEIEHFKQIMAKAASGRAFILQVGDCAENFIECQEEVVKNKLFLLEELQKKLYSCLARPVYKVGRIAGQYAKPRSNLIEARAGQRLPSYQGDMINAIDFTIQARTPDPERMKNAYVCAEKTLNVMRKQSVPVYASHEAFLLPYEQALTREHEGRWYNLSMHFPWVGYRTQSLEGAHIEYVRGIANPVAIKVGPMTSTTMLQALVKLLNPLREPGRLMLIVRVGANNVKRLLPPFIDAVKQTDVPVVWSCDPMHANTCVTEGGVKTRYLNDIVSELMQSVKIHDAMGTYLGGIHLEATHEQVTECVGGACGIKEQDLAMAYTSLVDPRLNSSQALEVIASLEMCFV